MLTQVVYTLVLFVLFVYVLAAEEKKGQPVIEVDEKKQLDEMCSSIEIWLTSHLDAELEETCDTQDIWQYDYTPLHFGTAEYECAQTDEKCATIACKPDVCPNVICSRVAGYTKDYAAMTIRELKKAASAQGTDTKGLGNLV